MKIKEQFCKWAKEYHQKSVIQQKCADILVSSLPKDIGKTLDLGCGSGRVYQEILNHKINYSSFLGIDFSKEILKLHKIGKNVELLELDFNDREFFNALNSKFDTIVSASALQWAKDLDFVFKGCAAIAPFGAYFLFGSNTFKSIHKIAGVESPIYTIEQIKQAFTSYYKPATLQQYNFRLEFDSTLEMLRYIKQSGVSGGGFGLGYKEVNKILKEYPHNYLEFETILLIGESR
jgi:malonyl-CoA O-methyltransferase